MSKSSSLLFGSGFKKWAFNLTRYNQLGLLHDDLYNQFNPAVVEALRRLPQDIKDERNFRICRAMQVNCTKSILPKEQWTKFEEDIRYLKPYIKEVEAEMLEKELWDKE
ncbi:cytochrome b-c1 complex subunit 7-like [Leptopilina heterotoma]|uniref:cytochrome b-c1 complex subunit 7-like n=1 Tax=Leptopilina heterotoma TaxID=63436 RepID=UPI001CA8A92E|nr:cytochrome b-c1 complex subunit 7-like [Leptopilina heterotoma]